MGAGLVQEKEAKDMLIKCQQMILAVVLLNLTLLVSGCWDSKEIQNRGYVLGVGIDHTVSIESKAGDDLVQATQAAGKRKYRVTFELPKAHKSQENKETASSKQHTLWSGEGESMVAISRLINTENTFSMFYENMQILVFSESVAREGIGDVLDFFLRDSEMRQRLNLFVTTGQAEDILESKEKIGEPNSLFIIKLVHNVDKSPTFAGKAEIRHIARAIRDSRSFVLPMVVSDKEKVKLTKAAIFNNKHKMVGELGELDVLGAKILNRELKGGGVIVVSDPANSEKIAVFELYETTIKINAYLQDGISFVVDAKLVGDMQEHTETQQDAMDPDYIKAVEKAATTEVTRSIKAAYSKQQELKSEVCNLGGVVYRQYPQYWKEVKDHWDDEVFPNAPLDVKVKVVIRSAVIAH